MFQICIFFCVLLQHIDSIVCSVCVCMRSLAHFPFLLECCW